MAYLHCHNCGWSQDDFWDENYNPWSEDGFIKYLLERPDRVVECDDECVDRFGKFTHFTKKITSQEIAAQRLENKARRIRNMFIFTYKEWQEKKDVVKCPRCGKRDFDID